MGAAISNTNIIEQHQSAYSSFQAQPERCVTSIVSEIELVKDALTIVDDNTFKPFESVEFSPAQLHSDCIGEAFEYATRYNLPSLDAVLSSTAEEACIEELLQDITDHMVKQFKKKLPKLQASLTESFISGLKKIYPEMDEQRMRDWVALCRNSHGSDFELLFCNGRSDDHTGNRTSQAMLTISTVDPCVYNLQLPNNVTNSKLIDAAKEIAIGALHAPFDATLEYTFSYGELINNLNLNNVKSAEDILKQRTSILSFIQENGMVLENSSEEEVMEYFEESFLDTVMLLVDFQSKRTKGKQLYTLLTGMAKLDNMLETYIHTSPVRILLTEHAQYDAIHTELEYSGEDYENSYVVTPLKAVDSMLEVAANLTILTFIDAFGCYNTPLNEFRDDFLQKLSDKSYNTIPLLPR